MGEGDRLGQSKIGKEVLLGCGQTFYCLPVCGLDWFMLLSIEKVSIT